MVHTVQGVDIINTLNLLLVSTMSSLDQITQVSDITATAVQQRYEQEGAIFLPSDSKPYNIPGI